jgi:hypothetical protein
VLDPEEAELVWTMLNHAATQLAHEPDACSHDDSAESRAVLSASATTTTAGHIDPCRVGDSAESRDVIASTPDGDVLAPGWHATPSPPSIDGDGATSRGPSALRQRADAAKRAFNRADALVSLAQGYLRGDRPHRSSIEITLTVAGSSLRAGAMDPLEAGEIGESFLSTETARRLSCDAGVVEVIEDADGMPLSVGRKRRTSSRSVAPVNPPPRGDTRSRNVVVSAAHFLFVPEIVARSDLVALVPARLAHRRTHDLQVFSPPIPVEGFQIAMRWHDRTHEHPGHRWVRDQLAISSSARPPRQAA